MSPQARREAVGILMAERQMGVTRAKVLARALKCHPCVLVFPGWTDEEAA